MMETTEKRCRGAYAANACVNYVPLFGQPHSLHSLLGQRLKANNVQIMYAYLSG